MKIASIYGQLGFAEYEVNEDLSDTGLMQKIKVYYDNRQNFNYWG